MRWNRPLSVTDVPLNEIAPLIGAAIALTAIIQIVAVTRQIRTTLNP